MSPETANPIDDILLEPLLARLATVSPLTLQPHVVPVWFYWDNEYIWISAFASTRKVKEIASNPRCAVVIDGGGPPESDTPWGVLLEGTAELIDSPAEFVVEMSTRIYTRYLGPQGVLAPDPQSWIHDPENRLICLKPQLIHAW